RDGQMITIDCSAGAEAKIYNGEFTYTTDTVYLDNLPKLSSDIMINIAHPDAAFLYNNLPVAGVGLARIEFIIADVIKIHPMALAHLDHVTDAKIRNQIEELTQDYGTPQDYFVDLLARNVATIAAAFYPRTVIVRFSDFKSNEYRELLGGAFFE